MNPFSHEDFASEFDRLHPMTNEQKVAEISARVDELLAERDGLKARLDQAATAYLEMKKSNNGVGIVRWDMRLRDALGVAIGYESSASSSPLEPK